jgi:hypothetical protein
MGLFLLILALKKNDQIMDLKSLLPDTSRQVAEIAARFIIEKPEYFEQMMEMALGDERKMAMRGSRVIYSIYGLKPELVEPYKINIIHRFKDLKHEASKRNLLRLYIGSTKQLDEECLGILLEHCFTYLECSSTEIAVKVYSLEIILEVAQYIPELKAELRNIIELQYSTASAAFQARAIRMLKKLNKDLA